MKATFILSLLTGLAAAQDPNPLFDLNKVRDRMTFLSSHSWEWGTSSEALLELWSPNLSVFGNNPFPGSTPNPLPGALSYAKSKITTSGNALVPNDGAVGDPASLGVFAVILGRSSGTYRDAANRQLQTVRNAPKYWNGAISHRHDEANLWADFIYMAPPFMAYHAVVNGDRNALVYAVDQCGKYRQVLQTGSNTGLWRHITGPNARDDGRWSTGNAWAAAGMMRVLMTVRKSPWSSGMQDEAGRLRQWIREILLGARAAGREPGTGLLRNYLNDNSWWGECAGTAMLAATALRMHLVDPGWACDTGCRDWALESYRAVARRVDVNGAVGPSVDPLNWNNRNKNWASPEAQAFTVMMYAAYRDCVRAGRCPTL